MVKVNYCLAQGQSKVKSHPLASIYILYSFPYSGNYNYGGGLNNQGSNGNWWSRSAYTTAGQAYNFNLNSNGNVNPQNNNNVGNGLTVRCVSE